MLAMRLASYASWSAAKRSPLHQYGPIVVVHNRSIVGFLRRNASVQQAIVGGRGHSSGSKYLYFLEAKRPGVASANRIRSDVVGGVPPLLCCRCPGRRGHPAQGVGRGSRPLREGQNPVDGPEGAVGAFPFLRLEIIVCPQAAVESRMSAFRG